MIRLITVHGIGRPLPDYAVPLVRNLIRLERICELRPIWWQDLSPIPRWLPWGIEAAFDLWMGYSWLFRTRKQEALRRILAAVGDGQRVIVAGHSWGAHLAIQALRGGPCVSRLVILDRAMHRLGGVHIPGHHEIRADLVINAYSTALGGGPLDEDHWADVGPVVNADFGALPHNLYWRSLRTARLLSDYWPLGD